jgi:hypothetical protein
METTCLVCLGDISSQWLENSEEETNMIVFPRQKKKEDIGQGLAL